MSAPMTFAIPRLSPNWHCRSGRAQFEHNRETARGHRQSSHRPIRRSNGGRHATQGATARDDVVRAGLNYKIGG
jgi:hypothetical protein